MLVLTRKCEERIVIGEVVITVVAIGPGRVRLGIEAPDDVVVRRAELPADDFPHRAPDRSGMVLTSNRKGRTP